MNNTITEKTYNTYEEYQNGNRVFEETPHKHLIVACMSDGTVIKEKVNQARKDKPERLKADFIQRVKKGEFGKYSYKDILYLEISTVFIDKQ